MFCRVVGHVKVNVTLYTLKGKFCCKYSFFFKYVELMVQVVLFIHMYRTFQKFCNKLHFLFSFFISFSFFWGGGFKIIQLCFTNVLIQYILSRNWYVKLAFANLDTQKCYCKYTTNQLSNTNHLSTIFELISSYFFPPACKNLEIVFLSIQKPKNGKVNGVSSSSSFLF